MKNVNLQVWDQIENQVWFQNRIQVGDQVWDQVTGQVRLQVWDRVLGQVGNQVLDHVDAHENQIRKYIDEKR